MTLNVNVAVDIGPNLIRLGGKIVALFDDLKAQLDDLKAQAASEHEQVLAAVAALETKIGESLDPDQKAGIAAAFADVKAAIGGIYEPPAPPV